MLELWKIREDCDTAVRILLNTVVLSAGTTDHVCEVTDNPTPSEAEIQFILNEIRNYLSPDINGL